MVAHTKLDCAEDIYFHCSHTLAQKHRLLVIHWLNSTTTEFSCVVVELVNVSNWWLRKMIWFWPYWRTGFFYFTIDTYIDISIPFFFLSSLSIPMSLKMISFPKSLPVKFQVEPHCNNQNGLLVNADLFGHYATVLWNNICCKL